MDTNDGKSTAGATGAIPSTGTNDGGDPAGGGGAPVSRTLPAGATVTRAPDAPGDEPRDKYAYRNARANLTRRMEAIERFVIDFGYGGSVERFDDAAGLDRDAD